ncbi:hypothetical protein LDENG_00223530 [Lucifuga dentata]|nr:hypothetical protein LDENG_00223530 [Lucifuga dentata]
MLWTIFLLLNGLLILVLLFGTRTRQKNEPPLDKGFLPWLGHALEFGKDMTKFLAQMKDKHGDIFTICVAGRYMTVLLDPNSYDAVLFDTVFLDIPHNRIQLMKRIFSLQLPNSTPKAQSDWLQKHLRGISLSKLNISMKTHLQNLFLNDQEGCMPAEWRQEGLFSLCCSLLFRAGYLTLFERNDNVAAAYKEFRKFDDLFVKLAHSSLNQVEKRTVSTSRERLWELLSPRWLSGDSGRTSWLESYLHFLQKEGVDAEMQTRALVLQLWITQTNPGPAVFWLLGFLLTHPKAMEAVKAEIRGLSRQESSLQHLPFTTLDTYSTPVFDSVLSETLRLTSGVIITRDVVRDKILHMPSGQEYRLRQGDIICMFPLLSPQMDPQIHQEPQNFKYNRFLNDNMTRKDKFYKDGKRVKYNNMPWGAGPMACPGKDLAASAIKQFVFLFLTIVDVELCDPKAKLPPVNPRRCGFGIFHPDGDLQVRYRVKRIQQ